MTRTGQVITGAPAVCALRATSSLEVASAAAADLALLVADLEQQSAQRWQAETLLRFVVDPPPVGLAAGCMLAEVAWHALGADRTSFWTRAMPELDGLSPAAAIEVCRHRDVATQLAREVLRDRQP